MQREKKETLKIKLKEKGKKKRRKKKKHKSPDLLKMLIHDPSSNPPLSALLASSATFRPNEARLSSNREAPRMNQQLNPKVFIIFIITYIHTYIHINLLTCQISTSFTYAPSCLFFFSPTIPISFYISFRRRTKTTNSSRKSAFAEPGLWEGAFN